MTTVKTPAWQVVFEGADLARDLEGEYLSVTYTDHLSGKADEIRILLKNEKGFWTGPGYPSKGDLLKVQIGREGGYLLPAGGFFIDDWEASFAPDQFEISGLAADILPAMRSAKTRAFEKTDLAAIVTTIAGTHSLAFKSAELPTARYDRISQNKESDLAFLHRLAKERGLALKVTSAEIFLAPIAIIEQQAPVKVLRKADVEQGRFRDKSHEIYKAATISYLDAQTGDMVSYTAQSSFTGGDTLKIEERVESLAHAQERAEAALREKNEALQTGSGTVAGDPALQAGNTVMMEGFGKFSGKYLITTSTHTVQRAGAYTTALEVRRV